MNATATQERAAIARGGALSFIGSATSAALGFLLTIVITRFLGVEGAGVVFQATGVFAVVMAFAKFGMDSTSIYLLPRLRLDDPRALRGAINACLLISLGVGLALVVALELLAPAVWAGELLASVRAIVVFVPVGAAFLIASAVLRALGSVKEYVLIANIAVPVLRPPVIMVAAVATGSAMVVSVAWALPFVLMVAIAALLISRQLASEEAGAPAPRLPVRERWGEIWRFAVPRTIAAGLEQAIIWVDVLLIGWLMDDAAVGVYGGAARFIQAGLLVDAALRVIVSPRFSALLHRSKIADARELYVTASSWLVLLATPAYLLLVVFPGVFLGLLGPGFAHGALTLSILAVGMMVTFLAGNIHSLLIMSGRSGWAAINKVIVLTVNVAGNVYAIPRWGIEGSACVWSACMVLDALVATIQVAVFVGIRPRARDVVRPLFLVVAAFGLPAVVAHWFLGASLDAFAVTVVVGVALYVGMCWRLRKQLRIDGLIAMIRHR